MKNKADLQSFRRYLRGNKLNLTIERRAMLSVVSLMSGWFSVGDFFGGPPEERDPHQVHRPQEHAAFLGGGVGGGETFSKRTAEIQDRLMTIGANCGD